MTKHLLYATSLAAVAIGLAGTANAAPLTGIGEVERGMTEASPSYDLVSYRRCWWRDGRKYCRRFRDDDDYYYDYDPGLSLYFGGFGGRGGHFRGGGHGGGGHGGHRR